MRLQYSFGKNIVRAVLALLLWGIFALLTAVYAADLQRYEVCIVTADNSEQTKRIVEAIQKKYPAAQIAAEPVTAGIKRKKPLYVAIGLAALRSHFKKEAEGPVISILTSNQAYRSILEEAPKSRLAATTAIYADPAPADQLRLISLIYKRRVSIAVLVSDRTAHFASLLSQAAAKSNIELVIKQISQDESMNRVLSHLESMPAILAIPDGAIYNSDSIRNILMTSYRSNQALIGFSASMVKAGALASTYSSVDDIVAQLSEMMTEIDATGRLPESQFPKYFSVVINDSVARSLDIVIDENVRAFSRKPAGR